MNAKSPPGNARLTAGLVMLLFIAVVLVLVQLLECLFELTLGPLWRRIKARRAAREKAARAVILIRSVAMSDRAREFDYCWKCRRFHIGGRKVNGICLVIGDLVHDRACSDCEPTR